MTNPAGEPGGRNDSRIKAGGRFATPGQTTPPRRAGQGISHDLYLRLQRESRADTKERLQYLAAGTAGTATGYGAAANRTADGGKMDII